MKCDKLFKEAFEKLVDTNPEMRKQLNEARQKTSGYDPIEGKGIHINSKIITAINKIIKTQPGGSDASINSKSLKNMLLREGVSQSEIDLLTSNLLKQTKLTSREKQLLKVLKPDEAKALGIKTTNQDKVSLQELLGTIEDNRIELRPLSKQYSDITYREDGEGNPTYKVTGIYAKGIADKTAAHFPENERNGLLGWNRVHTGPYKDGEALYLNEFQSDWAQNPGIQSVIGKFPIDHTKFKKLAIADALNTAITRDLDTMVIPIERTKNSLVGSANITKAYEVLGDGILPALRKELGKQGLVITHKRVVVEGDAFHEIKILPKPGQFENKHHPNFRDDGDNFAFVDVEALDLPSRYLTKIEELMELEDGKVMEIAGESFNNYDALFDEAGSLTISKALAKTIAGKKIPKLREVEKGIFYKDVERDSKGKAVGHGMKTLVDDLNSYAISVDNLPNNANHAFIIDLLSDESAIPANIQKQLFSIDTTKKINKKEFNEIIGSIQGLKESIPKYVLTENAWITDKNGDIYLSDIIIDSASYSIDDYNYYKELIPNLPEFFRPTVNSIKVRWDMLGVLGALGLDKEYEELKKAEDSRK